MASVPSRFHPLSRRVYGSAAAAATSLFVAAFALANGQGCVDGTTPTCTGDGGSMCDQDGIDAGDASIDALLHQQPKPDAHDATAADGDGATEEAGDAMENVDVAEPVDSGEPDMDATMEMPDAFTADAPATDAPIDSPATG